MDTRGWQRERRVEARGPDGKLVPIIAGLTHDVKSELVAAIGTDDGATLVLTSKLQRKLSRYMRAALADPSSEPSVASGKDTLGQRVQAAIGRATTEHGERVTVLAIGNIHAAAVLTDKICERLENNMTAVLEDVENFHRRSSGPR